jgi:hypothetical protein
VPAALTPREEEGHLAPPRHAGQQPPKAATGTGDGGQDDRGKAEISAASGVDAGKNPLPSALAYGIRPMANAPASGVSLGRGHAPRSRSLESKKSSKSSSSSARLSHASGTDSSEGEADMAAVMGFGGVVGRKDEQNKNNKEKAKKEVQKEDVSSARPKSFWTKGGLTAHSKHYASKTIYGKGVSAPEAMENYRRDSTEAADRPSSTRSPEHVIENGLVNCFDHTHNRAAGDRQKYSETKQFFTVVTPDSRMRTAYPEATEKGHKKIMDERLADDMRRPKPIPSSMKRSREDSDLTEANDSPNSKKR